jgi:predicted alpha/beta superfamily hydrolase
LDYLSATDKARVVSRRDGLKPGEALDSIPRSDDYLKFVVYELKPFIDSAFSTKKNRENTFFAGSSMGALISLYAICEYPSVFGAVACISTHWPGVFLQEGNPIPAAIFAYLHDHLPDPKSHRIYFDHGDATLDAWYPALQVQVDKIMREKGYGKNNWVTRVFLGEDHSERAWKKRLFEPISFILKKKA